jgi:hypothetical protein
MTEPVSDPAGAARAEPFYHGTRMELTAGDLIQPDGSRHPGAAEEAPGFACFTPDLDGAIWAAELAAGEGRARVYVVEPIGRIEMPASTDAAPGHPAMTWRSTGPLRVVAEVTDWLHYHGTRADLQPGDLIEPGHAANFGPDPRTANFVYFTRTLDAAIWGAELAAGEGPGRIYVVEPTGPFEDDPNLTDQKFRGNPTGSFRSRSPLRVVGEVAEWKGHAAETIQAMKAGLERLDRLGMKPMDD